MPAIKVGDQIVTSLFHADVHPGLIRRLAGQVEVELLLGSTRSKSDLRNLLTDASKNASQTGSAIPKDSLANLIDCLVIGKFSKPELQDKPIRKLGDMNLAELLVSNEWIEAVTKRSPVQTKESPRDEVFGLTFGHLIAAEPESFQLIDKFFLDKLDNGEEVVKWLLAQFNQRSLGRLVIRTKLLESEVLSHQACRVKLHNSVQKLDQLLRESNFGGSIELEVFSGFFHNRYFVAEFSDGSFAFEISAGIGAFAKETGNEPQHIPVIAGRNWRRMNADLELKMRPRPDALKQIEFPGIVSKSILVKAKSEWNQ